MITLKNLIHLEKNATIFYNNMNINDNINNQSIKIKIKEVINMNY